MSKLTKLTSTSFGRAGGASRFNWSIRTLNSDMNVSWVGFVNGYYWALGRSISSTSNVYIYRSANGVTGWTLFGTNTSGSWSYVFANVVGFNFYTQQNQYEIQVTGTAPVGGVVGIDHKLQNANGTDGGSTGSDPGNTSVLWVEPINSGAKILNGYNYAYDNTSSTTNWSLWITDPAISYDAQTNSNAIDTRPIGSYPLKRINAMTFGVATFVIVGNYDYIGYSTDNGANFTNITGTFGGTNIQAVAFGNGVFVAITQTGYVATSTNGSSWTARGQLITGATIISLTFASGTFVANSTGTNIFYSTTGLTWASQSRYNLTPGVTNVFGGTSSLILNGNSVGQLLTTT